MLSLHWLSNYTLSSCAEDLEFKTLIDQYYAARFNIYASICLL